MYGIPPKIPPVRRPVKKLEAHFITQPGQPVGLSQGLHRGLGQGLSKGLYQGLKPRAIGAPDVAKTVPGRPTSQPAAVSAEASFEIKVRRVSLLSGEKVTHSFCPQKGLVSRPLERGHMLVLTNQRVIVFGQVGGMRETVLMPVEEVKAVAVNAGRRSKGMLFRGGLMVTAGVFFYVLLAYWLTGRIDGPTIPVIRMDLVAFLIFLAVLTGIGLVAQAYFGRPDGEVTFQGDGVKVIFPFKGETAENQIYQVVDGTFAARQALLEHPRFGVK